jgi:ribosomal protein S13
VGTSASALTTIVGGVVHHLSSRVTQTLYMTTPVKVRWLSDEEGRQLQRIVRRGGGKTDRSILKWRLGRQRFLNLGSVTR